MLIRQVMHVEVELPVYGVRKGPALTRVERRVMEVAPSVARRDPVELPAHTGAGPCGTFARCKPRLRLVKGAMPLSPLAWAVEYIVPALRFYYGTYRPTVRLGARTGPRGRG